MPLEPYLRGTTWWAKGRIQFNGRDITDYIRESTGASTEDGARQWIAERQAREERRKLAAIVAVLFVTGWLTDRDEQCVTLIFIMIGCSIVIQAMRHLQKDSRHD